MKRLTPLRLLKHRRRRSAVADGYGRNAWRRSATVFSPLRSPCSCWRSPFLPVRKHDLLGAFLNQWPSYLAYVVSFSTIGALWLEHSLITEYLDQADAILVRLNLLLLLVVSFLPFPTRLLAEYLNSDNAERVAVSIYGLTLLVALSLLSVLWRYAVRAHLARTDMTDDELTALTRRLTPGLAGYVVLLGLGLFRPIIAVIGYLAIAIFFIVPLGRGRRRRAARSGDSQ